MGKPTPVPVPMEALLAAGLPEGEGWQFEPKWDGFRCLARRDEDEVTLTSKSGKPLGRYFPDVVETLRALKDKHLGERKQATASSQAELGKLGTPGKVEKVTRDGAATTYEATVKGKNGKTSSVTLDADGKPVKG